MLATKPQYLEFAGNLIPVTKSGDQLGVGFIPFQENRLAFAVRIREIEEPAAGRIAFMREPKYRAETLPPQHPICTLNVVLPDYSGVSATSSQGDLLSLDKKYAQLRQPGKLLHGTNL